MNLAKRISVLSLLLVFLVTNIGFGIYTHTCKISGTDTSYFFQTEDSCASHAHKPQVEETHACCSKNTAEVETGCCSTDKDYVQLGLDLAFAIEKTTIILSPVVISSPFSFLIHDTQTLVSANSTFINSPPPLFQGRDFQSIFQVYVI